MGSRTPVVTESAERTEVELLLCCTGSDRDLEKAARIEALLQEEVEWEYLLRLATEHGMLPFLFWHLDGAPPDLVPAAVLNRLREAFGNNARRNLFLTGKLVSLVQLFEAHEIPMLSYKGPVIAASNYRNLALREFTDLDILVHRRDVLKAKELLLSTGYRPQYRLNRAQESAFLRYHCEYTLLHDDDGTTVDLHWAIAERHFAFPLDPKCLWRNLQQVRLGGEDVRTLGPEDLLLVLCVQGSKDAWNRLKYICDIAELVRVHQNMDWERLMERASALGGRRMLFLGLTLASDLLGANLPEGVLERVRADPSVETLASQIRDRLFRTIDEPPTILEGSPFHPLHPKMRERWRDKLRYLVRTATTHTVGDWMALPLPRPLFFLYTLVRPFRLITKYGRRWWLS